MIMTDEIKMKRKNIQNLTVLNKFHKSFNEEFIGREKKTSIITHTACRRTQSATTKYNVKPQIIKKLAQNII